MLFQLFLLKFIKIYFYTRRKNSFNLYLGLMFKHLSVYLTYNLILLDKYSKTHCHSFYFTFIITNTFSIFYSRPKNTIIKWASLTLFYFSKLKFKSFKLFNYSRHSQLCKKQRKNFVLKFYRHQLFSYYLPLLCKLFSQSFKLKLMRYCLQVFFLRWHQKINRMEPFT